MTVTINRVVTTIFQMVILPLSQNIGPHPDIAQTGGKLRCEKLQPNMVREWG